MWGGFVHMNGGKSYIIFAISVLIEFNCRFKILFCPVFIYSIKQFSTFTYYPITNNICITSDCTPILFVFVYIAHDIFTISARIFNQVIILVFFRNVYFWV